MPARTHARSHTPSRARSHARSRVLAAGGADIRLRWWGVALPVIAFILLLVLMTGSGEAHAAVADPSLSALLERIRQILTGS
ncbi:hypothetical protein [Streptomyces sp. NPDC000410]|uniref:hypothetical protein n=1 Tax=Streptomyces sp. NPDC000410 TaxID=3154254 RepID=UPI003320BE66